MAHFTLQERSHADFATEIIVQARFVAKKIDYLKLLHGHRHAPEMRKIMRDFENGTLLSGWDENSVALIVLEIEEALESETLSIAEEFVPTCWIDGIPTEEGYVREVREITQRGEGIAEVQSAFKSVLAARQALLDRIAAEKAISRLIRGG